MEVDIFGLYVGIVVNSYVFIIVEKFSDSIWKEVKTFEIVDSILDKVESSNIIVVDIFEIVEIISGEVVEG